VGAPRTQWPRLGAVPSSRGRVELSVWAPTAERVAVRVSGEDHPLAPSHDGVFAGVISARAGAQYLFVLDGERALPDPCSRSQPQGIHGPSQIVDLGALEWTDGEWPGVSLHDLVIYELHVGAFSPGGTFDEVALRLPALRELGVTAVEVMPIGTFPGQRNWGYDGVHSSAPHPVYGGPVGFARLVDAAHQAGVGVILDVVYNHVGPSAEGVGAFGPYFTDRATTFWGDALDYSRRGVREWAIQNAELWIRDYHVDGLRLDAVHAIHDDSDPHVVAELTERVRSINPRALVIAEMETGDLRPTRSWGNDAQWADELHHELHVLLTGERDGYYADHRGSVQALARQILRKPPESLVVCSQNHDQVGNRALGDRPGRDELRIRAATVLLAPEIPLLFMGEEYGEQRPFQFFTDHVDPAIAEATREGRRREFERFTAFAGADLPDPQDVATFERSKLDPAAGDAELRELYRELLALRRQLPPDVSVEADEQRRVLRLWRGEIQAILNFSGTEYEGVPPFGVEIRGL
jgi:maltooligosyltrehalose trehalohydrolase